MLNYPQLKQGYYFEYTYDNMGNIATYVQNCNTAGYSEPLAEYTYDAQGQLTEAKLGTTEYEYTYDAAGNILSANKGGTNHTYAYNNADWRDLLTHYDGQQITYDNAGNPTSYYNGTRWTFTWGNGRRLESANNGAATTTYNYSADGIRTSKVVGGVTHTYYYSGGKLLRETYGSTVLDFFYDANGTPIAMKQNGAVYYYITNLQGDVVRLVNSSGSTAAYYKYDPYGNAITASGSHATINPLRYRGYYYDTETGLYYCQSRYYDPTIGRFINADSVVSTGQGVIGHNMFAYCNNNPINFKDAKGTWRGFVTLDDGAPSAFAIPDTTSRNTRSGEKIGKTAEEVMRDISLVSIYNGKIVIMVPGDSSFSFGMIFMGKEGDTDLLNHEYGHTKQLEELGCIDYFSYVVVPSVLCYWGSYFIEPLKEFYYSLPWEYQADQYGGVSGDYEDWANDLAKYYWSSVP